MDPRELFSDDDIFEVAQKHGKELGQEGWVDKPKVKEPPDDEEEEYLHSHEYHFQSYCGAYVCWDCDDHRGLARCYCGWAASGGSGRQELLDMGENLEEEESPPIYPY